MNNLKFSIITVCKNAEQSIEKTIKSVVSQVYENIEYIIIDGKSEDNTIQIINHYRDKITHFVSEKDNGIYEAMNKGIFWATGDFVSFLNAGDRYFDEEIIEKVNQFVQNFSSRQIDVFHGGVLIFNESTKTGNIWYSSPIKRFSLYRGAIPHPATFYRRGAFQKNGLFDETYKIVGDYEWTIRAFIRNKLIFQYLKILVAIFEEGGISTSKVSNKLHYLERRRAITAHYGKVEDWFFAFRKWLRKPLG